MDREADRNCCLYIQLGKREGRGNGLYMQVTCEGEVQKKRKGSKPAGVAHLDAIYRPQNVIREL